MKWLNFNDLETLYTISQNTNTIYLIFKHSTRCSISSVSLNRLERNWKDELNSKVTCLFIDLLKYRDLSNTIAKTFSVKHKSPQVLLIKNGKSVYHTSHLNISYNDIKKQVELLS